MGEEKEKKNKERKDQIINQNGRIIQGKEMMKV
jgi:hypothetical protein